MLRNLSVRGQILLILAIPLLLLAAFGGQIAFTTYTQMQDALRTSEVVPSTVTALSELVRGIQSERALTVAASQGAPGAREQLTKVRLAVTANSRRFTGIVARSRIVTADPGAVALVRQAAAANQSLAQLRRQADAGTLPLSRITPRYNAVLALDTAVATELATLMTTAEDRAWLDRARLLISAGEALAQSQLIGLSAIQAPVPTVTQQRAFAVQQAAEGQQLDAFRAAATTTQAQSYDQSLGRTSRSSRAIDPLRTGIVAAGTTHKVAVGPAAWNTAVKARQTAINSMIARVNADGQAGADADYRAARQRLVAGAGGGLAAVLLGLVFGLVLSRRVAAPIRRLTRAANQVRDDLPAVVARSHHAGEEAGFELPDVRIRARNEVGQLADAFASVNETMLGIAREQGVLRTAVAELFVSVARRNQVLLSRQLAFIDQLERTEESPESLENLFRLDHLATRMRRNAESLLVLAGVESSRRLRAPMPLTDVVRTATSEIEHYRRVTLSMHADPPVFGHLALSLAHLMAELLENATNFSDPGSSVLVAASVTPDGVRITITDFGLGLSEEELAEANTRIASPPNAEALGSQRLGLSVVGRLARRLDAKVVLGENRAGGTLATIDLPGSLFEPAGLAAAMPAPTGDGTSAPVPPLVEPAAHLEPAAPEQAVRSAAERAHRESGAGVPQPAAVPAATPHRVIPMPTAAHLLAGPHVEPIAEPDDARPRPSDPIPLAPPAGVDLPGADLPGADLPGPDLPRDLHPEPGEPATPEPGEPATPAAEPEQVPQAALPEPAAAPGLTGSSLFGRFRARREPLPEPEKPVPFPRMPVRTPTSAGTSRPAVAPAASRAPAAAAPVPPQVAQALEPLPASETYQPTNHRSASTTPALDVLPSRRRVRGPLFRTRRQPHTDEPPPTLAERLGGLPAPGAPALPPLPPGALLPTGAPAIPSQAGPGRTPAVPPTAEPAAMAHEAAEPRSALASEALTELSRLSAYSPAAVDTGPTALHRRTPRGVPDPTPAVSSSDARARTAANVRSMLTGFKAGVERGRTSPSAHRPAGLPSGAPRLEGPIPRPDEPEDTHDDQLPRRSTT